MERATPSARPRFRHVFWDWNGTLLDDTELTVQAVMPALEALGHPRTVTVEDWRAVASRPLIGVYEQLVNRTISPDEWEMAGNVWYAVYSAGLPCTPLNPQARAALDSVEAHGLTQSIVSLHTQERLRADVAALGVADRFTHISGSTSLGECTKAGEIEAQLADLGLAPQETIMIGDNVDDGNAAAQAGTAVVLVPTGDTSKARLEASGFPVADSLLEALDVILA